MVRMVQRHPVWVWRAAVVAVFLAFLVMYAMGAAHAQPIDNPLDGTAPDPSMVTPELKTRITRVVGYAWFIMLTMLSVRVMWGAYQVRQDQHAGRVGSFTEGMSDFKYSCIALALCACASPIVGGILFAATG